MSGREVLEVLEPGLLMTVQDDGRIGFEADGVPRSGAADRFGLAVANILLGNPAGAAGLECTLLGPRLRVLADTFVALGGADLGATVEPAGAGAASRAEASRAEAGPRAEAAPRDLEVGGAYLLRAGDVIAFRGPSGEASGCRTYLAVAGGIDVPEILGSRSTCLPAGFGGFAGRALRGGDRLAAAGDAGGAGGPGRGHEHGQRQRPRPGSVRLPALLAAEAPSAAQRIRVLPGPASDDGDPARAGLVERAWVVAAESDRRGLRLEPAAATPATDVLAPLSAGELPSHGVLPGAIQVTPAGQPLVLMPDAGTTGGYPVVAVVIQADVPLLGQLAPGQEVRFRGVSLEQARDAELERRAWLARVADAMADLSSAR